MTAFGLEGFPSVDEYHISRQTSGLLPFLRWEQEFMQRVPRLRILGADTRMESGYPLHTQPGF